MTFHTHQTLERAVQEANAQDTKLLAWFKLNAADASARRLLYFQVPEHYTWQTRPRQWRARVKQGQLSLDRMYSAHPGNCKQCCSEDGSNPNATRHARAG